MGPLEQLYYSFGEMIYAIAISDGKVQKEEKEKLASILKSEFADHENELDYTGIIFQLLNKDKPKVETAYEWAIKGIRLNSQYVSNDLKKKFINTVNKVAEAFPPKTTEEQNVINRFIKDLSAINGDTVFNRNSA